MYEKEKRKLNYTYHI